MIWLLLYTIGALVTFAYVMQWEWIAQRDGFCSSFWWAVFNALLWPVTLLAHGFIDRGWRIPIPHRLNVCRKMDDWRDKKGW